MRASNLLLVAWLTLPEVVALAVAPPRITDTQLVPRDPDNVPVPQLTIESDAGITNQVFFCDDLTTTNWTVLTNLMVTETPYSVVDSEAPASAARFYRVLALSPGPVGGSVTIPAGAFVMGDPHGNGSIDELPLHTTYVSEVLVDVHLVSRALWDEVYDWAIANGYDFDHTGRSKALDHPVVTVSWYDAVKWCNARSEKEGLEAAYWTDSYQTNIYRTGQLDLDSSMVNWTNGYRLPTEAEWEKAARGGAAGHEYPWTDTETFSADRANILDDPIFGTGTFPHTSPVGNYPANGYGLYDMAGNAWEWCWDWYDGAWYNAPEASGADTRGPASGEFRVLRGGSWNDDETFARCATRGFDAASSAFNFYGFRCVKGR